MSGSARGLVAVPAYLLYAAVALALGGTGGLTGVALLAIGPVGAGYLVGSPWAWLIAVPSWSTPQCREAVGLTVAERRS